MLVYSRPEPSVDEGGVLFRACYIYRINLVILVGWISFGCLDSLMFGLLNEVGGRDSFIGGGVL